jgi:hypothetical protein
MGKPRQFYIVALAFVVLSAIIGYQKLSISKLSDQLTTLDAAYADHLDQHKQAERQRLERDANHAMLAICVLAEFAQSERSAGPGQSQTIRSAEFELLYFAQQYLTSVMPGRPMTELLLSNNDLWQQWNIRGEYYPTLEAVSISLEAAKRSTQPLIGPEGNIRYLLERISRWLNKAERIRNSEQSGGEVRS